MASIFSFSLRSDSARVAALCIALLASVPGHANPANCDDDMTEDQRFQAELCSAHAGCRFVFGIADTCAKVKSFLSKLGLGGKGSATKVTDDRVSYALAETGVPPSGISSCLFDFDRAKCKEYLSGGPKQPSAKDQADEIVEQLKSKVYNLTVWDSGLGLAKEGLRMCDDATNAANVRDAVRAKERCALAEGNIRACLLTKEGHEALRVRLQSLIDNGGLGADAAGYRNLANTRYPECPTTLPSSGKMPKSALADYLKWWDTPEEAKSKQADTAEGVGTAALPSRGANSGSAIFQNSINQAEQAEKIRQAQEERERTRLSDNRGNVAKQDAQEKARQQESQNILDQIDQYTAGLQADVDAHLAENAKAEQERDAREVGEVIGLLVGIAGQIQQIKAGHMPAQLPAFVSALAPAGGAQGLPVAECHRQANASDLGNKLNAIPRNNTVLLARGTIVNLDFLIRTYTQCLPDRETQQAIDGWKAQREQTLLTCRQISSIDNCLASPYNAAANAGGAGQQKNYKQCRHLGVIRNGRASIPDPNDPNCR